MSESSANPRGALLVGSAPLSCPADVMRAFGSVLGGHLKRMPDGETGDRALWTGWQRRAFQDHPQFEQVPGTFERSLPHLYGFVGSETPPASRFKPRTGVTRETLRWERLGYAEVALQSYGEFRRLKSDGLIPERIKFQVSVPTPIGNLASRIDFASLPTVEPAYEEKMLGELDEIAETVPHGELAFQWDFCWEMWQIEGWYPAHFADPLQGNLERLTRLCGHIPADIELGLHLCYGDFQHRHMKQPTDAGHMVRVANGLTERVDRTLNWVHMPVPVDRSDDAYFAPLKELRLRPETELYLGIVHFRDGVEGAQRRIAAAQRVAPRFGVATECGMGRRPPGRGGAPDEFIDLLRIHRAVADPIA
jgi:hypothetical protein